MLIYMSHFTSPYTHSNCHNNQHILISLFHKPSMNSSILQELTNYHNGTLTFHYFPSFKSHFTFTYTKYTSPKQFPTQYTFNQSFNSPFTSTNKLPSRCFHGCQKYTLPFNIKTQKFLHKSNTHNMLTNFNKATFKNTNLPILKLLKNSSKLTFLTP